MKEEDVEDALIELGRKRGAIFFEELEDVFPAGFFPLDEMENLLERLDYLGVRVCAFEEWQGRRRHGRKAA